MICAAVRDPGNGFKIWTFFWMKSLLSHIWQCVLYLPIYGCLFMALILNLPFTGCHHPNLVGSVVPALWTLYGDCLHHISFKVIKRQDYLENEDVIAGIPLFIYHLTYTMPLPHVSFSHLPLYVCLIYHVFQYFVFCYHMFASSVFLLSLRTSASLATSSFLIFLNSWTSLITYLNSFSTFLTWFIKSGSHICATH